MRVKSTERVAAVLLAAMLAMAARPAAAQTDSTDVGSAAATDSAGPGTAAPPTPTAPSTPRVTPSAAPEAAPMTPEQELWSHWASGRQWLSLRAGYAKSATTDAANGSVGGGIGYSRMLSKWKIYKWTLFKRFSLGGYAHVEQLGRFGSAAEIEVPFTVELVRHFHWNSPHVQPYLGLGGGAFYRKLYRSGDDIGDVRPGRYLVLGVNSAIDGPNVLGVDMRFIRLDASNVRVNPVFGAGDNSAMHWSLKLNYSLTY